jgi:ketopantoate reductase
VGCARCAPGSASASRARGRERARGLFPWPPPRERRPCRPGAGGRGHSRCKAVAATRCCPRDVPVARTRQLRPPLQNGVEAPDVLRSVLGDGPPLGGIAKIISELVGPGHIRHHGGPSSLAFGELDDRDSERVERLRAAFRQAGVAVDVPKSIRSALWDKFLFVASMGGVGAVCRPPWGSFDRFRKPAPCSSRR